MRVPGKRIKRKELVESDRFVVSVEVELVIPDAEPSEPCYESETVNFLKEVHDRAVRGDVTWLRQHGKVYEAVPAA
jgi:hypothetical protein